MATNKNAAIRYQALDKCFRNPGRKYYIDDLVDACNDALIDLDPDSTGIQKRQLYEDIKFMQDSQGYNAPIESFRDGRRTYYAYTEKDFSITNQPLNQQEAQQLKESLLTLSRFQGLPQFAWIEELTTRLEHDFNLKSDQKVISFEENPFLTGLEYIGELYNAIVNNKALEIEYKSFKREDNLIYLMHPYHLKQYNSRWFLFGITEEAGRITNLPLDRIVNVKESKIEYKENKDIDFDEYFYDIIGVTIPYNEVSQKVKLKIDNELLPYIKTKPLHGSQKVEEHEGYALVKLDLIINYELKSKILARGDSMEVIEPECLRREISEKIKNLYTSYF